MISQIEKWFEPLSILEKMETPVCEMDREQQGFLCSLINKYKPKKVVEIGVAEGGTTAVIMKTLESVSPDAVMYSSDLNEKLYYDKSQDTGYLLNEVRDELGNIDRHRFFLGKYLPEVIDDIGDQIDFVILDTVHTIPGEFLDFLAILPYLSENAVVVFHDITLGVMKPGYKNNICTGVLFSSIIAEKIWNYEEDVTDIIGAVIINADTRKHIDNVFGALFLPWNYMPDEDEMRIYKQIFKMKYSNEDYSIFISALRKQEALFMHIKKEKENILREYIDFDHDIYIFGCGRYGSQLQKILTGMGVTTKGFVISDAQSKTEIYKILFLSEYIETVNDAVLIYGIKNKDVFNTLISKGVNCIMLPDIFWEM